MARMTRELKAKGIDIIGLSLGEPDFDTPDFIKEAANQAIADNYSHYTPVNGLQSLREAISMKFKRDNHLDYTPDQIVVSTGAKQSIANVVLSLVNEGDEVLLPAPYWVSYSEIVKVAGGIPVIIETSIEDDFKITPALLEKHINERTTMMIYSSPCNPSGSVYTGEELAALSAVIEKHQQLYVISDEIYELINYQSEHASLAQNKAIYDRVITINGVSKGFAMTGWRLGYIGAPKWIADACNKIQGQFTSAPCAVAQKAAEAAILADPNEVRYMIDAFKKRRDFVLARLAAMPGVKINTPEGAFYAFPDIAELYGKSWSGGSINDSSDFAMYLLEEAHVAVVAGEAFGDPNGIRISYAASMEDLEKAMDRIENAIKALA